MKAAIARFLRRSVICVTGAFVLACLILNLLLGRPEGAFLPERVAVLSE